MKEAIKNIMNREGVTRKEATEIYNEIRDEIYETGFESPSEVEDILYSYGFELDYIFDFI